jgi:hypothetical protein
MPFAEKSLTQATILFLAICHGFITEGTSVFSTSMSHLKTSLTPLFNLLLEEIIDTSSFPIRVALQYGA